MRKRGSQLEGTAAASVRRARELNVFFLFQPLTFEHVAHDGLSPEHLYKNVKWSVSCSFTLCSLQKTTHELPLPAKEQRKERTNELISFHFPSPPSSSLNSIHLNSPASLTRSSSLECFGRWCSPREIESRMGGRMQGWNKVEGGRRRR